MKKVLLFFAIAMMAITASAKVYEVSFLQSDNKITLDGNVMYGDDPQSTVVNGVKITAVNGSIIPIPSWEGGVSHNWNGMDGGNSFQISTENGETITRIEITADWVDLKGTGWTKTAPGAVWTGSATSVNVGESFSEVTKLTVTVIEKPILNTAGYATFSCNKNVNISGAEAYKASVNGETITLTKLTGYIPAGNGVILYSETSSATVTLSVAASGDAAANVSGNALKATTKADGSLATFEANSWALGDGQEFLHFTGDAYIHNRAYLVHEKPAGAKAMRMVFAEGETTGIDATMIETATREGKFLDGSKIVIIKNGTKYNVAGQVIK